jgi:hypothetical protein
LMFLPMISQRQTLIFFMMCKFDWGLLPFFHCCNQSTT